MERKRRVIQKQQVELLRQSLPGIMEKKPSTTTVVTTARLYIKKLVHQIHTLESQLGLPLSTPEMLAPTTTMIFPEESHTPFGSLYVMERTSSRATSEIEGVEQANDEFSASLDPNLVISGAGIALSASIALKSGMSNEIENQASVDFKKSRIDSQSIPCPQMNEVRETRLGCFPMVASSNSDLFETPLPQFQLLGPHSINFLNSSWDSTENHIPPISENVLPSQLSLQSARNHQSFSQLNLLALPSPITSDDPTCSLSEKPISSRTKFDYDPIQSNNSRVNFPLFSQFSRHPQGTHNDLIEPYSGFQQIESQNAPLPKNSSQTVSSRPLCQFTQARSQFEHRAPWHPGSTLQLALIPRPLSPSIPAAPLSAPATMQYNMYPSNFPISPSLQVQRIPSFSAHGSHPPSDPSFASFLPPKNPLIQSLEPRGAR
jgi:hypothetical protein